MKFFKKGQQRYLLVCKRLYYFSISSITIINKDMDCSSLSGGYFEHLKGGASFFTACIFL